MSLALLFPGQGAQHAAMLPWLWAQPAAAPALQSLSAVLGGGWQARLADAAWLHANAVAQPLLTGLCLAAWRVLAPQLPAPVAVAGYSVGELAAFAAAGVFDDATAVPLAAARAQAMDAAAAGRPAGLLAVQGPQANARVMALAQPGSDLAIAIRISPERVIVGGPLAALEAGAADWSAAGLRCSRLPIGVASHTPAMAPAAAAFAAQLAQAQLRHARVPVVCNFTGATGRTPAVLAPALSGQIASTVRWDDCMDTLAERQPRCVLEVGPGAALAAMWRERHPGIPARSIDEFSGVEGVVRWVEGGQI